MAGAWTCYRGYTHGLEESNNFGLCNCDDLHVGRWLLRKGKCETHLNFVDKTTFKNKKKIMSRIKNHPAITAINLENL